MWRRLRLIAAAELARLGQGLATRSQRLGNRWMREEDAIALTARYYRRAAHYRRGWHSELGLFDFERQALQTAFPPPPARVLVLGVGGGRELGALRSAGYAVDGCDPVPALAAAAKQVLGADGQVLCCGAEALDGAADLPGPYDAALFGWGAWSHLFGVASRRAALRALRARLRPNAPLLLSWPLLPSRGLRHGAHTSAEVHAAGPARPGAEITGTAFGWRMAPGGLVHVVYGEDDLRADAEATGFGVECCHGAESGYPNALLRVEAATPADGRGPS